MIDSLGVMVRDSLLTKLLATVFIFLALCAALIVAAIELLNGQPLNPFVQNILFAGLGYALHLLGLNQGVTLQQMKIGTSTPVSGSNTNVTQKLAPATTQKLPPATVQV